MWSKGSAACWQLAGSDDVWKKAFADRGESSEGMEKRAVAEGRKDVAKAKPHRDLKGTPENMLVIGKSNDKSREQRAELSVRSAEMEAREGDLSFVSQMAAVENLNSVKEKLKKMKENCYGLMVGMQLTRNRLQRVNGESKEKDVLIESLREAAKARKRGEGGQKRGPGEVTRSRQYKSCEQVILLWLRKACTRSGTNKCKAGDIWALL